MQYTKYCTDIYIDIYTNTPLLPSYINLMAIMLPDICQNLYHYLPGFILAEADELVSAFKVFSRLAFKYEER